MKELIICLSLLFSFVLGKENKIMNELSDLQAKGERSLKIANRIIDDYNSGLLQFFEKLTDKSLCLDSKVIDQDYLNFTKEMKKIILPMNDWIFQTSKRMRLLDGFLYQLRLSGDLIYSDVPTFVLDSFLGDCSLSFSKEKPEQSINTNDIYEHQNKMNCGREGSEEFRCGSGECIHFNRTCDGVLDCWDGSDELGACRETAGCEECSGVCDLGPRGPRCLAECPPFGYSLKFCPNSKLHNKCYSLCSRKKPPRIISAKCLVQVFSNVLDTTNENYRELAYSIFLHYWPTIKKCQDERSNLNEKINLAATDKTDSFQELYATSSLYANWHTTTRHPTWHPTTRHPTWQPTTRHPTWHPTTRHPTWHPTTRHPTWHPTTRHPTWHPTTRHPTWHPTTRHPTWHPTTRHTTWHPTTRHPTWHPTTRHPTWHPTTRHPTWHPTTRHTTWHPTTRHPTTRHSTWHPTTRHTTWPTTTPPPTGWIPPATESITDSNESDYSAQIDDNNHHTTKHTTPHSTTAHTKHTTRHHTTKHTTKHTTTTPTTPTTSTTPHTTTPSKSTPSPTTTTNAGELHNIML